MLEKFLEFRSILLFATLTWCFYYPYKQIEVYYLGGIALTLIYFLTYGKLKANKISMIVGLFLLISISGLAARLYFAEDPLRDLSEIVRLVFVLLFSLYIAANIEKKEIIALMSVAFFVILNSLVSWLQFEKIAMVEPLTNIYASAKHIEDSLEISKRALGFSSGPGQNGVATIIFGIYAFVMFYFKYQKKAFSFALLFLTFLTMLLSQSQTSFAAMIGALVFVLWAGKMFFPRKFKIPGSYIFIILSSLGYLFYKLIGELRYLGSLFTFGLERNSYQERELKWAEFFEQANENPWLYIIGHGKSYFGENSGAMDNEYVFILLIYGVFVFLVLYALIVWSLLLAYKDIKKGSGEALAYIGVVICGLISAWPNTFFTDGRVAVVFLISLYIWVNSRKVLLSKKY